jgi:hypothetical protein
MAAAVVCNLMPAPVVGNESTAEEQKIARGVKRPASVATDQVEET